VTHLYNFGLSQEDERTEAAALALGAHGGRDRVLSIASAGDMPLSLLALGAEAVIAVDVDTRQLHLARLKAAAVRRLDREEAIRFLGFMPASRQSRRRWLREVLPALPPDARLFWEWREEEATGGAIWAGRYERYIRWLMLLVKPFVGFRLFEPLFECHTLQEQRATFERVFNRPMVRAIFRLAFHPRIYASRGIPPRSLQFRSSERSLGDQFFDRFRSLCTATPARSNHLLQLTALGRVQSLDAVPEYLTSHGFAVVRARGKRLAFHQDDLLAFLERAPRGAFNKAHLSNLADWLPQVRFEQAMRLLYARMATPARLVWRYIHVDRALPSDLQGKIRIDRGLGERLLERDRFPFYGIVPARIDSAHEEA
jgi:S-adenosylmethionine-diacylglycerol 3-amino-3-carboxypropyl transferase